MVKFRVELDALNAIYEQQVRTNELLEQLLSGKEPEEKAVKHASTGNRGGNHRKTAK